MHARSFRRIARGAAALALVLLVSACTSWHRTQLAPGAVTEAPLDHVRLVHVDGRQLELWTVSVARDTLFGYTRPRWNQTVPPMAAVPLDSVRLLEVRDVDARRTTGLVVGVAGTGLLLFGVAIAGLLLILSQLQ